MDGTVIAYTNPSDTSMPLNALYWSLFRAFQELFLISRIADSEAYVHPTTDVLLIDRLENPRVIVEDTIDIFCFRIGNGLLPCHFSATMS